MTMRPFANREMLRTSINSRNVPSSRPSSGPLSSEAAVKRDRPDPRAFARLALDGRKDGGIPFAVGTAPQLS
jgi:hypothetical protein